MLSWAVPEGPSLDPKDKRLAIRTDDHPLDYLTFQGVIPEGEYAAGVIRLWDSGFWSPVDDNPEVAFEADEVKFRLSGDRLGGGWMLKKLLDEKKPWLLIKERDPSVVKAFKIDAASLVPVLGGSPEMIIMRLESAGFDITSPKLLLHEIADKSVKNAFSFQRPCPSRPREA